jgi:long-chain fatty acid transport protein
MKARFSLAATTVLGGLLAAGSLALPASATEGYFQHGYGVRQYAVGGAGVADSRDAMSMSINPAGIVHVDRQLQLGIAAFMPYRSYEATDTAFVAPGDIDSDRNIFFVPNVAYTQPIDDVSSWGVVMYGNGGMNTSWPDVANTSPGCVGSLNNSGAFCGGDAGVDLMQAFMSAVYARQFGPLSIGIAPTVVVQRFKASGLRAFGTFGFSEDSNHLSNEGYDWSWGGGLRAGVEFAVNDRLRLGLSGQTKMWMTKFDQYAGLFKNQGNMDIPPAIVAGLAFDATPDLTLMFDYKHIFYSDVPTVGDPTDYVGNKFGSDKGPGFGWADVDAFKFGVEWRANETWTLRAGYAYNTNPIDSEDVELNILAPGVVQHHITGGLSYRVTPGSSIDFSGAYMPTVSVSGPETLCGGDFPPCGDIKLSMHQFQFALGWTYHFGE